VVQHRAAVSTGSGDCHAHGLKALTRTRTGGAGRPVESDDALHRWADGVGAGCPGKAFDDPAGLTDGVRLMVRLDQDLRLRPGRIRVPPGTGGPAFPSQSGRRWGRRAGDRAPGRMGASPCIVWPRAQQGP
jgi:hypothetical protein